MHFSEISDHLSKFGKKNKKNGDIIEKTIYQTHLQ